MIAETLALALALAAPAATQRPADPPQTNAARARRGLLPRKLVRRAPARGRRVVLLPAAAPTLLGEPSGVADPVVVLAEADQIGPDGAPRARLAPMASGDAPGESAASTRRWASAEGTEVHAFVVRRPAEPGTPVVRAGVTGAEVQAVIRRSPR